MRIIHIIYSILYCTAMSSGEGQKHGVSFDGPSKPTCRGVHLPGLAHHQKSKQTKTSSVYPPAFPSLHSLFSSLCSELPHHVPDIRVIKATFVVLDVASVFDKANSLHTTQYLYLSSELPYRLSSSTYL